MTPFVQDADFTLYLGDVRECLRELPAESVHTVVTSPPYWGLRDYGTGAWEGGNPDCDHAQQRRERDPNSKQATSSGSARDSLAGRESCRKCGATRVDQQLGLEPTPEAFVAAMVDVFREVRRVLAAHGTCWVNLGDSYAGTANGRSRFGQGGEEKTIKRPGYEGQNEGGTVDRPLPPGLKQKDLCGMPWRVAFALQADGWYLRSDIIWAKPNPMPESVTDRPTKAHEYVFLLTRQPRYWFDQEAVREDGAGRLDLGRMKFGGRINGDTGWHNDGGTREAAGRNIRSVWEIATQPYPEAHFATYPEELVRRCLLAGCPEWVCRVCGRPRERIVESQRNGRDWNRNNREGGDRMAVGQSASDKMPSDYEAPKTLGWSDCGHNNYRPGIVLDPFVGSGTTAYVARKHGRHAIGIDLNADYLALAARRLQQQSLFADPDGAPVSVNFGPTS